MKKTYWEHFPHQADMGVRGFGASRELAFAGAALAMTATITDPTLVRDRNVRDIHCEAPDDELLLVDWLNALIYEMAVHNMLFCRFDIRIEAHRLSARAWGERIDPERHHPVIEIKGATYTSLKVEQRADGQWVAQCVIDI